MSFIHIDKSELQTLLDLAEGRTVPQEQADEALATARTALCAGGVITTPGGNEVFVSDLDQFHRAYLVDLPYMDELLEQGYAITAWQKLSEDDLAEVGDRVNFYSDPDGWYSPEFHDPVGNAGDLADRLERWLILLDEQATAK